MGQESFSLFKKIVRKGGGRSFCWFAPEGLLTIRATNALLAHLVFRHGYVERPLPVIARGCP